MFKIFIGVIFIIENIWNLNNLSVIKYGTHPNGILYTYQKQHFNIWLSPLAGHLKLS